MTALSQVILILISVLVAAPAHGFSGHLEVTSESLRVKRDDGFYVRFYPGRYEMSLTLGRKQLRMDIDRNGIQTGVTLRYPPGTQIPQSGDIAIDGTKTGQSFAVNGPIQTEIAESPTYQGQEGCTYYRREWVCRGRDHKGRPICRWEDVPHRGYQDVEYHFVTKTVNLLLEFNSDNGGKANFSGREKTSRKVYTYIGRCW